MVPGTATTMYTRCPNCSSTFRVTESVLRVADGDVQCGACDTIFNALDTLFDDGGGTIPPAEVTSDTSAESRATDDQLEFNAPEQEWQRFFLEPEAPVPASEARVDPGLGADFDALVESEAAGADAPTDQFPSPPLEEHPAPVEPVDREIADTEAWEELLDEPEDEPADAQPPFVIVDKPVVTAETILDWNPAPAFPERTPRLARHTAAWAAAGVVAALVLGGQALHHFRDELAASPSYGGMVRALYDSLGQPLYPAWPLEAYEVRGAKAIVENTAPGALDVIAEIAVTGRQPVGLPMVRVVLRDRWSNPLASGVFDSATYLAEPAARSRVYAAGTLIPVAISVKDPGMTAQGYEIDICLPNRHFGLQCKTARDPFRR